MADIVPRVSLDGIAKKLRGLRPKLNVVPSPAISPTVFKGEGQPPG